MTTNPPSTNDPRNWTEELVSGHQIIDDQHRELLRRFEALEDAVNAGQGFKEIKPLLAFLQRYVLTHFNTEEQVMLAGKYPGSAHHADQHDQCKDRIFKFKEFITTESDRNKVIAVAYSMLGIWVRDHILNQDIQFIQYIKGKKESKLTIDVDYAWSPETSEFWKPDLLLGVDEIDEQHRSLVKWTEYLKNAKSLSRAEFHSLLDFIHGFMFTHFTDEEVLMIDIQYPGLQKHTELHCATRARLFEVKQWLSGELNPRDMQAMVLELFEAYVAHIETHDTQFKPYLCGYSQVTPA